MKNRMKVLLVDDHPIVRQGLAQLIQHEPDLVTCGEAESASEALDALAVTKPDIAIVDISLKKSSGLDLIKDMKQRSSRVPVLVLSMHDETLYAERALRAGARGYVMKQEAAQTVINAIHRVLSGHVYVSEKMAARMLDRVVGQKHEDVESPIDLLSDRELEVFRLIGEGCSTRQISQRLHVAVKTVETHRAHIKDKLKLGSASELVHQAILWVENQRAL
jgi:DNA-binding NarL/FixJ family response regulator